MRKLLPPQPLSSYDPGMPSAQTPLAAALERVGDRWSLLLIEALLEGPRRFGELSDSISGLAPNILSERLKRLEEAGIVERACFAEVPPRVQYSLTAKGHALLPVIDQMRDYGRSWLSDELCVD